jgi:hypothetical protein
MYGFDPFPSHGRFSDRSTSRSWIKGHDHGEPPCSCRAKNRDPKNLYATEQEAREAADYCHERNGVRLRVYPCPSGRGWHLTSKLDSW